MISVIILVLVITTIIVYKSKSVSSASNGTDVPLDGGEIVTEDVPLDGGEIITEAPVYLKEENACIFSSAYNGTDVHLGTGEIVTEGKAWEFSQINGVLDECKKTCNSLLNCMGFSRRRGSDSESLPCYMKSGQGTKESTDKYDMYFKKQE